MNGHIGPARNDERRAVVVVPRPAAIQIVRADEQRLMFARLSAHPFGHFHIAKHPARHTRLGPQHDIGFLRHSERIEPLQPLHDLQIAIRGHFHRLRDIWLDGRNAHRRSFARRSFYQSPHAVTECADNQRHRHKEIEMRTQLDSPHFSAEAQDGDHGYRVAHRE